MTQNKIGDVLLIEIMVKAALVEDIAPLTTAYLLQQTVDTHSNVAIRRYAVAAAAARNEQEDEDGDTDFVSRHEAVLAGIAAYLNAIAVVEA
jgi:hypothetical protein